MPTYEYMTPEMKENLTALQAKGVFLNQTELWVYSECAKEQRTIRELAEKRKLSYQAMHNYVNNLRRSGLLTPGLRLGKEQFWKVPIDLNVQRTLEVLIAYKRDVEHVGNMIWYFHDTQDINLCIKLIGKSLAQLSQRAEARIHPDMQPAGPSGPEVHSLLRKLHAQLVDFTTMVEGIINTEAYFKEPAKEEEARLLYEQFGGEHTPKTTQFIRDQARSLRNAWKNSISSAGILPATGLLDVRQIMKDNSESTEVHIDYQLPDQG